MKKRQEIILVGLLAGLSACGTLSAPKPSGDNAAAVAITVSLKAPLVSFIRQTPEVVYFVMLDNAGQPVAGSTPIVSNERDGSHFYLFNAKPGRYAVVGAMYTKQGNTSSSSGAVGSGTFSVSFTPNHAYGTFFNKELVKLTEVTVKPGELTYVGDFVVSMHNGMDEADSTQKTYTSFVDPQSRMAHYRGNSDSAATAKKDQLAFLNSAREKLAKTGWEPHLQKALARLGQ